MLKPVSIVTQVASFIKQLDDDIITMIETLDTDKNLEKYDIQISTNGNSLTIPMNADYYETLTKMLIENLKQDIEQDMERRETLASFQEATGVALIAFSHLGHTILNPFKGLKGQTVDPIEYYHKSFIHSTWCIGFEDVIANVGVFGV